MHHFIFTLGTVASLFLLLAQAAQLRPPRAIEPPYNAFEARQEHDLLRDLPCHQHDPPSIVPWPLDIVPKVCYEYPKGSAVILDKTNMEARDVYYSDCDAPWTICRYKDSLIDWDKAMLVLGKIPVGMRQHVAHVILAPESYAKQKQGVVAETMGPSTAFLSAMNIGVAAHEFSHILDAMIGAHRHGNKKLSDSPKWNQFFQNDTMVPTSYVANTLSNNQTSLVEDFADSGRWAMSNMARARAPAPVQSPPARDGSGGDPFSFQNRTMLANILADYSGNWTECQNQITGYRKMLEDLIFPPGGRCTGKAATSEAVNTTTGERVHGRMGAGKHKLRSVGVAEIVAADWAMKVQFPPYRAST